MNFLFKIIDFFYQKKKYTFLKKNIPKNIDIFFDIGAHNGDSIFEFLKIEDFVCIYNCALFRF